MRTTISLIGIFLFATSVFAQKEDYNWMLGYILNSPDSLRSPMIIDFNEEPFFMAQVSSDIKLYLTNAIISSSEGELICYSNGVEIRNKEHEIIINGDDFQSPTQFSAGYPVTQGAIFLPYPDSIDHYFFISGDDVSFYYDGILTTGFSPLTYSVLKFEEGDPGEVIEKKTTIITDTLTIGMHVATRHANGRDWWLLSNRYQTNEFYRFLVSPEGVSPKGLQAIGDTIIPGLPQAAFSPDGAWYAQYNASGIVGIGEPLDTDIDLYQFDRCTGLLSNPINIFDEGEGVPGGVSFSPNSHYMYISAWDKIYQFDMEASDIAASRDTVAIYDGFEGVNGNLLYATRFYNMQNAPDGKIYISCPNTSTRYLHVIDQPDSVGVACNILQHEIELPSFNRFSLPNLPNFRLGALEGSPCDTIEQVVPPIATFDCLSDTVDGLLYHFADNSSNSPDTWLWDFGDGSTSQDTVVDHLFPGNGTYEICLTAGNSAGQDSVCKTIIIQMTGIEEAAADGLSVYPNPVQTMLYLRHSEVERWDEITLLDVTGRELRSDVYNNKLSVKGLPDALYVLRLKKGEKEWTRRVLVQGEE